MSNLRDIRDHPQFRNKLDPEHPNFERDQYLQYLEEQETPPPIPAEETDDTALNLPWEDESDPLIYLEENPVEKELHVGLSICRDCQWKEDNRPWWKRLLFPDDAQVKDLLCTAFPKRLVRNPITGKEGYLPKGTHVQAALATDEPFMRCITLNSDGTCLHFQPKITYR